MTMQASTRPMPPIGLERAEIPEVFQHERVKRLAADRQTHERSRAETVAPNATGMPVF